jgi:hypothetical protein
LIIRRWQRVALRMSPASCEAVAAALLSAASGFAPMRYLRFEQATEGWSLDTGGRVVSEGLCENHGLARAAVSRAAERLAQPKVIPTFAIEADRSLAI